MKIFVYAIMSIVNRRIYVGQTQDMKRRIYEHNTGQTKSTKAYKPWTLIYFEELDNRGDARIREKYLKSGCGKEFLKKLAP